MSGRRRILVTFLAAMFAVVVVAVLLWGTEREPEYQGRKLSEWIGTVKPVQPQPGAMKPGVTIIGILLIDTQDRSPNEIASAIRRMGTNAVERLIEWLAYEPSPWRKKLSGFQEKLPTTLYKNTLLLLADKREYRALAAQNALCSLNAREVPMHELQKIATRTNSIAGKRAAVVINSFRAADAVERER